MNPKHILILLMAAMFHTASAQTLSKEGTHEISKKANKGYLYEPKVDEAKNEMTMTYVTKASGRFARFETYTFDLDFNFKGMKESEVPLEKIKGYKADKGEEYTLNSFSVSANLLGTLVLQRKIVTRKWNWFWGGYDTKVKLADKLKPKTDDGEKLTYFCHAEQDETESVLIVCGPRDMKNAPKMYSEIHFLRYDKEMNKLGDNVLNFDYPQYVVSASIDNESDNDSQDDYLFLFAPVTVAGKKAADPDPTNYTFVRVSYDGTVKEKIPFKSKAGIFNGNMFITTNDGVVILGAVGKDNDYFNEKFGDFKALSEARESAEEEFKAKGFQVVKIKNGKIEYVTITTLDDFENKVKTPPGQKKAPEYTGKRFKVSEIKMTPGGDIFIAGQKFKKGKDGGHVVKFGGLGSMGGGGTGPQYEDIIMMHFGNDGNLKAAYGVRREENDKDAKASPNNQMLVTSNDGKSLYWMIMEMKGVKEEKELGDSKYKFLIYPNVTKVDIANASLTEFVQFGQGKSDYFLNNKYPFLPIGTGQLVFMGETKSGKTLWFGKMPTN
jgi:hypothetical protein